MMDEKQSISKIDPSKIYCDDGMHPFDSVKEYIQQAAQSIHNNALQAVMSRMEIELANSDLNPCDIQVVERMLERVMLECKK